MFPHFFRRSRPRKIEKFFNNILFKLIHIVARFTAITDFKDFTDLLRHKPNHNTSSGIEIVAQMTNHIICCLIILSHIFLS